MIDFLSLKLKSFALDISDFSLKAVKLKRKRNHLKLASWGEVVIKPGIIEEGQIKDQDAFVRSVREIAGRPKGERLKTNNVVASLPERKAFLAIIQMPKMNKEELRTAVPFEAENHIPISADEAYMDFQIINPLHDSLDHFDVLVAASPKEIVDSYLFCLKKAGLNVLALEIESLAICRALIRKDISPFPVLVVDFGGSSTSFVIFSGRSVRFTSSSIISSRYLDQTISRSLNISLEEAEKLKLKYGFQAIADEKNDRAVPGQNAEEFSRKDISDAMIPVLADLAGQIKKYLLYYQGHASHEHLLTENKGVQKIILCGSGANLKGLANLLSLSLKVPVELGNPWVNILPESLKKLPNLSFEESLGYTTALGLALRKINLEI